MKQDSNLRSIAKTFSWRFVATSATAILVVIFTGNWQAAFVIGGSEAILKMVLYFFHERVWNQVAWGKVPASQKVIAVIEDKVKEAKSIVPEVKKILLQLQKPAVILDGQDQDPTNTHLTKKWVREVADHSIYPIFVFNEWNHKIHRFLEALNQEVVIINSHPEQIPKEIPYQIINHGSGETISKTVLRNQLSNA